LLDKRRHRRGRDKALARARLKREDATGDNSLSDLSEWLGLSDYGEEGVVAGGASGGSGDGEYQFGGIGAPFLSAGKRLVEITKVGADDSASTVFKEYDGG